MQNDIDPKASRLHQEARLLGQSGNYAQAIQNLEEAIRIAPDWAYPYYDLAFTHFLQGNSKLALEYYRRTDALQPRGFFTAKTAIYALQGEQSGRFPEGIYGAYMQIEWADDPAQKLAIARALTQQVPHFAPAWKELFAHTDDPAESQSAIEQGLAQDPDPETKGILLINRAMLLRENGNVATAREILEKLMADPETTAGNLALARFAMRNLGAG